MKPYYQDEQAGITLYHGDAREVLPGLALAPDLVLTDPPYGNDLKFGGMGCKTGDKRRPIEGNEEPFDPSPLLELGRCVLWGANHYADALPPSKGWLVWVKTQNSAASLMSEAELAWSNCVAKVAVFQHLWQGQYRGSEAGFYVHPTQKPVALMRWVLGLTTRRGDLVLDPYMGSGPVAQACAELERRYVGIELEERHCETAARRLQSTTPPLPLFVPAPAPPPLALPFEVAA